MKNRLLILALFLALGAPAPVWAHSTLLRSQPKAGAVLKQEPNEIKIWFTEPLKIGLSTVEVKDSSGKTVKAGTLVADAKEPALIHLALPADLKPGSYQVLWTAVAQDMHVSKGSFAFRLAP